MGPLQVTSAANTLAFYPIDILRIRYFLKKKKHKIHKSLFNGLSFSWWSGCIKGIASYPAQEIIRDEFKRNGYNANQSQVYSDFPNRIQFLKERIFKNEKEILKYFSKVE